MSVAPHHLAERLDGLMIRDRQRLGRRLARLARHRGAADEAELERIAAAIAAAERRRAARAAAVPAVSYPDALPVSAHRAEILAALGAHQVLVVAGETGSGKTTQIPKMCLELGRGVDGMIGHTQPRRIAARTVAERLAEELEVPLGGPVGYAVRFTDTVSDTTLVKVMTDGILLAEIRRDRLLSAYDTIIVDEAHERSLNIDFLLGFLAQLLPRRPDLKVIVTSATIDTQRFAAHFDAPVVEVSGRTFPVEVRYRPIRSEEDGEDRDPNQAIVDAVAELSATGPGDVLVFLPGERDIRDAADALRAGGPPETEILPLYARLSAAEQHRVFRPARQRRVVLATNVAETSLTVPGIRFVVDTGLARISRYSHRTKVQRLPIEPISQASANQRAGRCGRVAPGICIRLYAEEDFAARPAFTDPEILRTNLAAVLLQMAANGLGEIEAFPFLEAPERRSIADGRALLEELGAFEQGGGRPALSAIGRRLAELPVDPRLGRMVVEAEHRNALREVIVIAAALSIQDPRERPLDKAAAAEEMHRRFADRDSDFLAFVRLWDYLAELQRELSGNQFRRRCRDEFLNVLRVREWQDLAGQIRQALRSAGVHASGEPAGPDQIHQALLAGLLSHVGLRDRVRGDYRGARDTRFVIGRASALARRQPAWVMAGELVETERTYARTVARLDPAWAEQIGAHLVKRRHGEPFWDAARAEAVAEERVSLYGLPIVSGRRISYARVDPAGARDLFIQRALIEGEWAVDLAPRALLERRRQQIRALEERVRRHGLLAGDEELFSFYDERIPAEVTSGNRFLRWWRRAGAATPTLLDVPLTVLLDKDAGPLELADYPDRLVQGNLVLPLDYRWSPGAPDDGVQVRVPLAALPVIDPVPLGWHVPGRRAELVAALVRTLPKAQRRALPPAAAVAETILQHSGPQDGAITEVVAQRCARIAGMAVSPADLDPARLPADLRLHVAVVDADGALVGRGDDLAVLRGQLQPLVRAALARALPPIERHGLAPEEVGDLPPVLEADGVRGYPALADEGGSLGVVVCESPEIQAEVMWAGARRFLVLAHPLRQAHLERRLTNAAKLAVARAELPLAELFGDCALALAEEVLADSAALPYGAPERARLVAASRPHFADRVAQCANAAGALLAAAERVDALVERHERADRAGALRGALDDVRRQVDDLVHPGFIRHLGARHLADALRYLAAAEQRLERLPADLRRDASRQAVIERLLLRYDTAAARVAAGAGPRDAPERLAAARRGIEELRVSLWAQALGTPEPVSEERVARLLAALGG